MPNAYRQALARGIYYMAPRRVTKPYIRPHQDLSLVGLCIVCLQLSSTITAAGSSSSGTTSSTTSSASTHISATPNSKSLKSNSSSNKAVNGPPKSPNSTKPISQQPPPSVPNSNKAQPHTAVAPHSKTGKKTK